MTTVKEIVEAYLKAEGFDGLFNDELDSYCSCRLGDLEPCDGAFLSGCQPGFIRYDGPGGHQWTITAKRERDAAGEGIEDI